MNWLARFIYFKIMGWKFYGSWPAGINKAVVIVVPHTSWHDFYLGLLVRRILGVDIKFVAKKELFKPPFGWYFRWMGGTPLDRTAGQNKVDSIAALFGKKEEFRLAIAPEGTRKKVKDWKTGFYYIAKTADVPIVMIAFDFGKKRVKISKPMYPTGDKERDFDKIRAFYKEVTGKIAHYT
ncbi:1-acyl-sn-glycerol-3-phosphate acyltransferases [Salinimicrobium sediminis]|uniref:1-acyl-sn-glycerol-3-phosphate acyltransferases n=1 Tax=Salinimicrobium sediminis TaxID=1343891 RepID=A0A285X4H8_9FLAO|nr:1-acyl-sn-glycerol-3-phosphate acyltransferase [Salinimicrobium sediminis]SOC80178.1 1-acyl-sn-glycerol-3-phosphate acyltransferases [Salinimicrobium sediminis]